MKSLHYYQTETTSENALFSNLTHKKMFLQILSAYSFEWKVNWKLTGKITITYLITINNIFITYLLKE